MYEHYVYVCTTSMYLYIVPVCMYKVQGMYYVLVCTCTMYLCTMYGYLPVSIRPLQSLYRRAGSRHRSQLQTQAAVYPLEECT